jgi:hypothetical protein
MDRFQKKVDADSKKGGPFVYPREPVGRGTQAGGTAPQTYQHRPAPLRLSHATRRALPHRPQPAGWSPVCSGAGPPAAVSLDAFLGYTRKLKLIKVLSKHFVILSQAGYRIKGFLSTILAWSTFAPDSLISRLILSLRKGRSPTSLIGPAQLQLGACSWVPRN